MGLPLRRSGDLADQAVDLGDLGDDPLQRLARAADQADAGLDLLGGGGDQGPDLLGGLGRALGQGPDFLGHDREATTAFARAGGLDAGVQGQEVGLEGDLVDDADDVGDLLRRALDGGHGADGVADHLARAVDVVAGAGHHAGGFLGARSGLGDRGGDFVHRRDGLFQAGGLALGAARQIGGGLGDLIRAGAHAADPAFDDAEGVGQLGGGGVVVRAQGLIGLGEALLQAGGQVATRQVRQSRAEGGDGGVALGLGALAGG